MEVDRAARAPSSAAHRSRMVEQATAACGWSRSRRSVRLHRTCPQAGCDADVGRWCRRSPFSERRFGFVHDSR